MHFIINNSEVQLWCNKYIYSHATTLFSSKMILTSVVYLSFSPEGISNRWPSYLLQTAHSSQISIQIKVTSSANADTWTDTDGNL